MSKNLSRRDFLKYTGMGSAAAFAAAYDSNARPVQLLGARDLLYSAG